MEIRLQKLLANAGVASRRKAEELIVAGRVTVNGVVAELGGKAGPGDALAVDGQPVAVDEPQKIYIMLHKPEGVVTTVTDPFNRTTVMDCVSEIEERLFPVGRLDYDTSGLLLLTNDGDWTNSLTHPRHEVRKTYIAVVKGVPTADELRTFRQGLEIEGRRTSRCEVEILPPKHDKPFGKQATGPTAKLRIIIKEGRNRQVRKMCEAIGHPVISLKRVAIGGLRLDNLPRGKWRHLTIQEVKLCLAKS
ncbi:MAG: rRNA pseudouridine synthase [Defluviitaleaceae bacterium]|nr:rRNA pseudouridine synthase [Defluviitaleaceae bacterium]